MSLENFTLVIILHNRHANLDRLLQYYDGYDFPICIADSSSNPHVFNTALKQTTRYLYTPGISYTAKIEQVLDAIRTPFVALCADDDFLVPDGIKAAVDWLQMHDDYTAAQGNIIKYYNQSNQAIVFDIMYVGDFTVAEDQPLARLKKMFHTYKSILYAVHRVDSLKASFANAGATIHNLYLNEYLSSIVPVLKGKVKDIGSLYQVREYSLHSDDKTAVNLDILLVDNQHETEINGFLALIEANAGLKKEAVKGNIRGEVRNVLDHYMQCVLAAGKSPTPTRKKLGNLIKLIPFFGPVLIAKNRQAKRTKRLNSQLNCNDFKALQKITGIIKSN